MLGTSDFMCLSWEPGVRGVAAGRGLAFFLGCISGSIASLAEEGMLPHVVNQEPKR